MMQTNFVRENTSMFEKCIQVAKAMGITYDEGNTTSMAILRAQVKNCKTRPHSCEELATQGHLEYYWTYLTKAETTNEKIRKIELSKRKDISADQCEQIEDMIDAEEPVDAVEGRIKKRHKGMDDAAKKQKQLKQQEAVAKREQKLNGMSDEEKAKFLENEERIVSHTSFVLPLNLFS